MILFRSAFLLALIALPVSAHAAEMVLNPNTGVVSHNELFDVVVEVQGDEPISAAEALLTFNPAALSVEAIDTAGSVLVSWPTQPVYSNERGVIEFSGSTDTSVTKGRIMTIRFRARSNGVHEVRFENGALLAGGGSNVISTLSSGIYRVEPVRTDVEVSADPIASITEPPAIAPIPLIEKAGELQLGDRLIVKGLVVPGVLVHVLVETQSGAPNEFVIPSAGDGSFTYASDFRVTEGVYRVRSFSESNGVRSELSETVTYTVRPLGLAAAAATTVDVLSFLLPFLALVTLLGSIGAFIWYRVRH
jgi:hypothetical protein